jgi:hypothetical protein
VQNFAGVDKYVEALLEARKGKNMTHDVALDAVTGDVNMFGVMMVAMGDAGGMVSGSIHTTAATIRPAMQVLKTPNLVSSIFFMCLPDKVRTPCGSSCGLLTCSRLTAKITVQRLQGKVTETSASCMWALDSAKGLFIPCPLWTVLG